MEKSEEIRKREKEINRLKAVIAEMKKEKENAELKRTITELKGIKEIRGSKRIKKIKSFSKNSIIDTKMKYGIKKGDIIFLEDGSGGGASTAELLAKEGISAVIYGKELSHLLLLNSSNLVYLLSLLMKLLYN